MAVVQQVHGYQADLAEGKQREVLEQPMRPESLPDLLEPLQH